MQVRWGRGGEWMSWQVARKWWGQAGSCCKHCAARRSVFSSVFPSVVAVIVVALWPDQALGWRYCIPRSCAAGCPGWRQYGVMHCASCHALPALP